jgi:NAD(P)-dependent dehydrogenase (short-subunit alcohol dehydrogenase family)
LKGKRVVVVGASTGIGHEMARLAIQEGARVVMAARRIDKLDELAKATGGGVAVSVDIRQPADCEQLAQRARDELGGVDLLLCTVGYAPLRMFPDATVEDWNVVLNTNVIGVHQLIKAMLPVLEPGAIASIMSSETVNQARTALGIYAASKAALETSLTAWRIEHPQVRFSCVAVGGTFPTGFSADFDPELLISAMQDWARHGLVTEGLMAPDEVAEVLLGTYAAGLNFPGLNLEHLLIRSPSPVVGSSAHLEADAVDNIAAARG